MRPRASVGDRGSHRPAQAMDHSRRSGEAVEVFEVRLAGRGALRDWAVASALLRRGFSFGSRKFTGRFRRLLWLRRFISPWLTQKILQQYGSLRGGRFDNVP